ncbi:hypothetical protein HS125_08100 [bacterium]|nr:hypothetical protein [bacterium]
MERAIRVLNELEKAGVIARYAIGGAVGAIFYMEPFLTYDLDVFVLLPSTSGGLLSLTPLYQELQSRGYASEAECVNIEGIAVQFLPAYNALVEEALREAREADYHGVTTRVFAPEHLAAIMLQTGRDKDRQRLAAFMVEARIEEERLRDIIARHRLMDRWNQWK